MKIGLWSDSVNFPSLPLMKLSAYHKELGDEVEFIEEEGCYDKAYLSKVFNLPLVSKIPQHPPRFQADEIEKGGTGYAITVENGKEVFHPELHKNLPDEIERLCPDYSLYPQFSEAYGFLTRGCCNNCSFCIVTPKEGTCSRRVADLNDFWKGQKMIKLLDPNILACRDREALLQQLIQSKARVDFTQGLDARFLNEDIVKMLLRMKIKAIHFAFDFMKNENAILKGFDCFNRFYTRSKWNVKCYILTNYDTTHQEDWYRVCKVREHGMLPDVRIYQKGTHDQFLTDLQRWCNNPLIFNSTEFADYVPRSDGKSCGELYSQILNERKYFSMATQKPATKNANVETSTLNIWQKLLLSRRDFLGLGVKKTGINLHAEFKYFELEDIVPVATEIFTKYNCVFLTTFPDGKAIGRLINLDNLSEEVVVEFTARSIAEPGKFRMNEVQGLGAELTYMRRYLYFLILDVLDPDKFDSQSGKSTEEEETETPAPKKKPATTAERNEIKNTLTNAEGEADDLQKSALKAALKKLKEIDPSKEEFIQQIAIKTDKFTSIKKAACEKLILTVNEMIENYNIEEDDE